MVQNKDGMEGGAVAVGDIGELYVKHRASVLRRAMQILGNDAEARDVVQEVFVTLINKPSQFDGRSSIMTWLYSVTTHLCLNKIRNASTRRRILEERVKPITPATAGPSMVERAEVQEILARVPEELAQVAIYYYFDELTHDEIAQILGCSRRNVGHLLTKFSELAKRGEKVA